GGRAPRPAARWPVGARILIWRGCAIWTRRKGYPRRNVKTTARCGAASMLFSGGPGLPGKPRGVARRRAVRFTVGAGDLLSWIFRRAAGTCTPTGIKRTKVLIALPKRLHGLPGWLMNR